MWTVPSLSVFLSLNFQVHFYFEAVTNCHDACPCTIHKAVHACINRCEAQHFNLSSGIHVGNFDLTVSFNLLISSQTSVQGHLRPVFHNVSVYSNCNRVPAMYCKSLYCVSEHGLLHCFFVQCINPLPTIEPPTKFLWAAETM